eukprot:gene1689-3267_t
MKTYAKSRGWLSEELLPKGRGIFVVTTSDIVNPGDILKGCIICTTGLKEKSNKNIEELITKLGGTFQGPLAKKTTHLVAVRVGSAKFEAAISRGIPCVSPEWVFDCEKLQKRLPTQNYGVKPFEGLAISITQIIDQVERMRMQTLIENGGGRFLPNLIKDVSILEQTNTHLVAAYAGGSKFLSAQQWGGIHLVGPSWVDQCVARNGNSSSSSSGSSNVSSVWNEWLNEKLFPVPAEVPDDEDMDMLLDGGMSQPRMQQSQRGPLAVPRRKDVDSKLSDANIAVVQSTSTAGAGPTQARYSATPDVFSGETFFLSGLEPKLRDRLLLLILSGGGRRHPVLSEKVTKVVLGEDADPRLWDAVRCHPFSPQVVRSGWIERMSSETNGITHPEPDGSGSEKLRVAVSSEPYPEYNDSDNHNGNAEGGVSEEDGRHPFNVDGDGASVPVSVSVPSKRMPKRLRIAGDIHMYWALVGLVGFVQLIVVTSFLRKFSRHQYDEISRKPFYIPLMAMYTYINLLLQRVRQGSKIISTDTTIPSFP